jgi:PhnB protein
MASRLNPYLSLPGTAREAAEFYRDVFSGELSVTTFGEAGAADAPHADQVMHARLDTSSGYTLMHSDMPLSSLAVTVALVPALARAEPAVLGART